MLADPPHLPDLAHHFQVSKAEPIRLTSPPSCRRHRRWSDRLTLSNPSINFPDDLSEQRFGGAVLRREVCGSSLEQDLEHSGMVPEQLPLVGDLG